MLLPVGATETTSSAFAGRACQHGVTSCRVGLGSTSVFPATPAYLKRTQRCPA